MSPRVRRLATATAGLVLLLLAAAGAWQASRPGAPATAQDRAVAVEQGLRCPTCQGLSIADSPSPIATGMRQQVERQLAAGADPEQVRNFFTARYGDWILLDPPRRGIGWLVWLAPAVAVLAGAWLVRRTLRRRAAPADDLDEVSPGELGAADAFARRVAAGRLNTATLPEPVTAALADLRAARLDAETEPTAADGIDDARRRLVAALREHRSTGAAVSISTGTEPDSSVVRRSRELVAGGPRASAAADSRREPDGLDGFDDAGSAVLGRSLPTGRRLVRYALPAAALLFAGILATTLLGSVGDRPAGAVVTGNFASGSATRAATTATPTALELATRERPLDPAVWLAYGTALDQAGDLTNAERAYRRTLALDPANLVATEQYAWLLTRGGSPREALSVLTPAATKHPEDPQVVLLLGLGQRGAGDPAAPATLQHYLELAPDTPQAGVVRGLLGSTP